MRSSLLLWAACTGRASATWVCGGDVEITKSWDNKDIDGHCSGDYEGNQFMPGDRVPFGSGPKLSGTLPAALASNQYIETLWLKNNLISGTLPPAWQALGDTLLELDLSNDRLSGSIPTEYGLLTSLTNELNLNGNSISGTLPTELGLLAKLTAALSLNDNRISGTLPTQLAALSKLSLGGPSRLRVDGNRISGTLPQGVVLDAAVHPGFRPSPPSGPPSLSPPDGNVDEGLPKDDTSGGSTTRRGGVSALLGTLLSGAAAGLALFLVRPANC